MTISSFIFAPLPITSLPIQGSDKLFPVHRIYCVGRNYADHAIEMGHDPNKEPPFFFQKNPDNLVVDGCFPYPTQSNDVHHEIELVVALKDGGNNLTLAQAENCIFGFAIGLDMTRRDLQAEMKKAGRPWEIGKAFEASAPCTALTPIAQTGLLQKGRIALKINGDIRQDGNLDQMIWKLPEIISYLSKLFTLKAGDLIMTGTPAGVGSVQKGDVLEGMIEGLESLHITVV